MAVSQSLTVTQQSQNINNNTSVVRILWTSTQSGGSYNNYTRTAYYYVSINGGSETRYSVSYNLPANTTKTIVDTTITVNHLSDGTGSVKVRVWMDTDIGAGVVQKSQTLTLTTIPRATTPALSGTYSLGGTLTISTASRASTNFTHSLYYSWGSQLVDVAIATGVTTSTSFVIPKTFAEYVQAGTTGTLVIKCVTYNGSNVIGTKTVSATISIPDTAEFQPTIENVLLADANDLPIDRYVVGKTRLVFTVTAVGGYVSGSSNRNSYIVKAVVRVDGRNYSITMDQTSDATWSITTGELLIAGANYAVVTVTDSRGRTYSRSVAYTAYEYFAPQISSFTAQRCLSNGTLDDSGTYLLCNLQTTVASVNNLNAKTYKIVYDNNGTEVTLKSGTLSSYADNVITYNSYSNGVTFSVDYAWNVRAYVYDSFNSASPAVATVEVPTEATFMDWRSNGKGFAFGKVSTKDGIETAWPIYDMNDYEVGIESMELADGYGHIKYANGVLIQFGTVSITPSAANTVTSATVTFERSYKTRPQIFGALQSNVPHVISWGIGAGSTVAAGLVSMVIYMTRTNVNATSFRWMAIGEADDS